MLSTAAVAAAVISFAWARQLINKKVLPTANARLGINLAGIVDCSPWF